MIFAAPWVLFALAALPLLWWLLRVTPPAPRIERFPAIRLLLGLMSNSETPARTPLWLLVLRCIAAGLVIVGLAQPVLESGAALPGTGPVLLVIDDGWASARDWGKRIVVARTVLDRAERAGRKVILLATAPTETGASPTASLAMDATVARPLVEALRPKPWGVDRKTAAQAAMLAKAGAVVAILDGLEGGADWNGFATALAAISQVSPTPQSGGGDARRGWRRAAAAAAARRAGPAGGSPRTARRRDPGRDCRGRAIGRWAHAGAHRHPRRGGHDGGGGADAAAAGIAQPAVQAGDRGVIQRRRRGAAG
ncbi:MAG: BatA domain-containing protein [Alphaproteobacteria bacterium]|nr:BatA domain-containing protein [Alphaproteobacteria bacterium]